VVANQGRDNCGAVIVNALEDGASSVPMTAPRVFVATTETR
jgi:hypothetical protein